jgi:hypothetical protein
MIELSKETETALAKLDELASASPLLAKDSVTHVKRAAQMALAMKQVKDLLTPAMVQSFMHLQGTPLGFLTDKDKTGGYDAATLQDVLAEAFLRGFYPINNEFNVISGRFYGAKNGFYRKVCEFKGLTDLELRPGVPVMQGGGALVPYTARWRLNEIPCEMRRICHDEGGGGPLDQRIPVKVNQGMGADAIIGKATRKILAAIYQQISGTEMTPEGEVLDVELSERKPREHGTLTQEDLSPSAEPNRGHDDTGLGELGEAAKNADTVPVGTEPIGRKGNSDKA